MEVNSSMKQDIKDPEAPISAFKGTKVIVVSPICCFVLTLKASLKWCARLPLLIYNATFTSKTTFAKWSGSGIKKEMACYLCLSSPKQTFKKENSSSMTRPVFKPSLFQWTHDCCHSYISAAFKQSSLKKSAQKSLLSFCFCCLFKALRTTWCQSVFINSAAILNFTLSAFTLPLFAHKLCCHSSLKLSLWLLLAFYWQSSICTYN